MANEVVMETHDDVEGKGDRVKVSMSHLGLVDGLRSLGKPKPKSKPKPEGITEAQRRNLRRL